MELNTWKTALMAMLLEILAYFRPLGNEIFILAMVFVVNFFAGLMADYIKNNGSFQFKKAWKCITELTIFFAMVVFIYIFGEKKGSIERAVQCVSFLTYVVTWFYSQNILRNLRAIFKEGTTPFRIINFLYYIVSVEFVKHIPFLNKWLDVENVEPKEKDHENTN